MAQWQEKGGEPNSLFGLNLSWNTCEDSNPRGGKKNTLLFQTAQQGHKRERKSFPVKGGRHKLVRGATTLHIYNFPELGGK